MFQIVNTKSCACFQFRAKDTCICNISSLSVINAVSIYNIKVVKLSKIHDDSCAPLLLIRAKILLIKVLLVKKKKTRKIGCCYKTTIIFNSLLKTRKLAAVKNN